MGCHHLSYASRGKVIRKPGSWLFSEHDAGPPPGPGADLQTLEDRIPQPSLSPSHSALTATQCWVRAGDTKLPGTSCSWPCSKEARGALHRLEAPAAKCLSNPTKLSRGPDGEGTTDSSGSKLCQLYSRRFQICLCLPPASP